MDVFSIGINSNSHRHIFHFKLIDCLHSHFFKGNNFCLLDRFRNQILAIKDNAKQYALDFTKDGSIFLFGETLVNNTSFGAIFAFQILPTIVFFSALTSVLFYLGILQKIVYLFALIMKKIFVLEKNLWERACFLFCIGTF